eukprot:Awhi_evm1s3652
MKEDDVKDDNDDDNDNDDDEIESEVDSKGFANCFQISVGMDVWREDILPRFSKCSKLS